MAVLSDKIYIDLLLKTKKRRVGFLHLSAYDIFLIL